MAYTARFGDSFVETSDTDLDLHTPTGTTFDATGWTEIGVNGGTARVDGSDDTVMHPYGGGALILAGHTADQSGSWSGDHECEAIGVTHIRIGTRLQDDGGGECDGYSLVWSVGESKWLLMRVDSGLATSIGAFVDASGLDTDLALMRSEGDQHQFSENGTLRIGPLTDTTYTDGSPGLFSIRSLSTGVFDDFVARDQAAAAVGPTLKHPIEYHRHNLTR